MAAKRPPSPHLILNPFIKKRNLGWVLDQPPSEPDRDTSEASSSEAHSDPEQNVEPPKQAPSHPSTAAVEAGSAHTLDHLAFFSGALARHTIPSAPGPRLPVPAYSSLYRQNAGSPLGAHFVIHQHDHPVAGTHYDLRLQINELSSVSWAIMYGLPGDPNSTRLSRNATETRIHCLWNHLVETASAATGSLLIWDTGTYSILPRRSKHAPAEDPSSPQGSPRSSPFSPYQPTQQSLLHDAFQSRKIRLRLQGTRLPDPYVLNLRLTKPEDASGRAKSTGHRPQRRRRAARARRSAKKVPQETSSSSDEQKNEEDGDDIIQPHHLAQTGGQDEAEDLSAMTREIRELEDEEVRRTNAYPGASNTIGSIHQRSWYLSLDRPACGFVAKKGKRGSTWNPLPEHSSVDRNHGDESTQASTRLSFPFHVLGADHERSVVTGRRGFEVLRDEGVTGFVQRKGWRPVTN